MKIQSKTIFSKLLGDKEKQQDNCVQNEKNKQVPVTHGPVPSLPSTRPVAQIEKNKTKTQEAGVRTSAKGPVSWCDRQKK